MMKGGGRGIAVERGKDGTRLQFRIARVGNIAIDVPRIHYTVGNIALHVDAIHGWGGG